MAYSNWGAFIYFRDKDVTDICADTSYMFKNGKWNLIPSEYDFYEDKNNNDIPVVGSHAVVPLTSTLVLECYKTYISLHTPTDTIDITDNVLNHPCYEYEGFKIIGYYLNKNENIIEVTVSRNDKQEFCIVCGMSVGRGFEKTPISKFVKKHLHFDSNSNYYVWDNEFCWEYGIEQAERKEEIQSIRHMGMYFNVKPFLKALLHFRFDKDYFDEIKEDLLKIKYLK